MVLDTLIILNYRFGILLSSLPEPHSNPIWPIFSHLFSISILLNAHFVRSDIFGLMGSVPFHPSSFPSVTMLEAVQGIPKTLNTPQNNPGQRCTWNLGREVSRRVIWSILGFNQFLYFTIDRKSKLLSFKNVCTTVVIPQKDYVTVMCKCCGMNCNKYPGNHILILKCPRP